MINIVKKAHYNFLENDLNDHSIMKLGNYFFLSINESLAI